MSLKDTAVIQRYSDGDVIISEGIVSNNAYIILSGEVRITKKVNNKVVIVGTLGEGDVFGEMGLLSNTVRSASVVAHGHVTVGFIDKETFDELLNSLPDDLRAIMIALVSRLRSTTEMLTRIGCELENTRKSMKAI